MEVISGPAHIKPGIGWFLKRWCALSQCIVGVVVGFWALECWVVLREVWFNEGNPIRWFNAGEERRAKSLKGKLQGNSK